MLLESMRFQQNSVGCYGRKTVSLRIGLNFADAVMVDSKCHHPSSPRSAVMPTFLHYHNGPLF